MNARTQMFAAVAERYGVRIARELQRRHGTEGAAIERAYAAALGVADIQDVRAYIDRDRVTILECALGCRAAKRITPGGILDYACGKWFSTSEVEVAGIAELARFLGEIERNPRWFVIRGRLIAGRHPGRVRRLLYPDKGDGPYFEPSPRRWVGIDFDALTLPEGVDPVDLDAVAAQAIARLPETFHRATVWAR